MDLLKHNITKFWLLATVYVFLQLLSGMCLAVKEVAKRLKARS